MTSSVAAADNSIREQMLHAAFEEILAQEKHISEINTKRITLKTELDLDEIAAERIMTEAWKQIKALMAETGEYEVTVPGEGCNYKIGWNTPRMSVDVDEDAVPKEYCKEVLKPKLKEIKELLESGTKVNWARFKEGEKKLQWKAVKF